MSRIRLLRWLSGSLLLLALITLVAGASRAAQGPAFPDRFPGGSPIEPFGPGRYLPPEQEAQEEPTVQEPTGVYGMNWSRVVFQSYRNKRDYDIYIATPDGNSLNRLTTHSANDMQPRLNRGATEIVFTSRRAGNWELYRMNSSGGALTRLTSHGATDADPCWSPSGDKIAFASDRSGQAEIYVMNRDGSNVRQLTHNAAYDGEPSWSPDGKKIAFTSKRSGGYRIWVMNADGSGAHMLNWEQSSGRPSWSPDSKKIAFQADGDNDSWFDIFVMNADGSNHVKIYNGYGYSSSGYDAYAGSWSPDGRFVSFTRVSWVKYYGNWYWQSAQPQYISSTGGYGDDFNYSWNTGWHPDWQTTDISAPYSNVDPLMTHARDDVEVSWTAKDVGKSGLDEVLVQYRIGENGAWTQWSTTINEYDWHKTFEKLSGETVYFRSRAKDKGGNIEEWPPEGFDTKITFYDWLIDGQIGGNRGQPLDGATLMAGPEAFEIHPSDASGHYQAYFKGADYSFSPSWGKDGYGQLPETTLRSEYDRGFDVILPPADNMVADWGFENMALDGNPWQTGGSLTPDVGEAYRHTGGSGAFLGLPFDLETPTPVHQASRIEGSPLIKGDDSGALHLLWREGSGWDQVIYYARKPAGGGWSAPLALSDASNIQQVMWASTDAGQVHVLWKEYDYPRDTIHHIWRSEAGAWSDAQIVHSDGRILLRHLEVDAAGGAHLVWRLDNTDYNDQYYSHVDPLGSWDSPIRTYIDPYHTIDDLAVGPDGTPHLLWRDYSTLYYSILQSNGAWSGKETLMSGSQSEQPQLAIDSQGQVHVVFGVGYRDQFAHLWRAPDGGWSKITYIAIDQQADKNNYIVMMDPEDVLHIAWRGGSEYSCRRLYYLRRYSNGNWSMPTVVSGDDGCYGRSWLQYNAGAPYLLYHSPLRENDYFCSIYLGATVPAAPACADSFFDEYPDLVVDTNGVVQAAWKGPAAGGGDAINHTQSKTAATNDVSTVSQQVTIPLTLTNPTLSLVYSLQGGLAGSEAKLTAQIDDGGGPVVVMSADEVSNWAHQWADLSAWAGQTVMLTVQVQQETGVPQVGVMLDEVTLGSAPPDLWLNLDGPMNAPTGDEINLILDYGNRAPSLASGIQLSLTLPAGLSFASADPAPAETTPALIWDMGDLANTDIQTPIIITATMDAEFEPLLFMTALSEVTCQEIEIEMANNIANHSIRVGWLVQMPTIMR